MYDKKRHLKVTRNEALHTTSIFRLFYGKFVLKIELLWLLFDRLPQIWGPFHCKHFICRSLFVVIQFLATRKFLKSDQFIILELSWNAQFCRDHFFGKEQNLFSIEFELRMKNRKWNVSRVACWGSFLIQVPLGILYGSFTQLHCYLSHL